MNGFLTQLVLFSLLAHTQYLWSASPGDHHLGYDALTEHNTSSSVQTDTLPAHEVEKGRPTQRGGKRPSNSTRWKKADQLNEVEKGRPTQRGGKRPSTRWKKAEQLNEVEKGRPTPRGGKRLSNPAGVHVRLRERTICSTTIEAIQPKLLAIGPRRAQNDPNKLHSRLSAETDVQFFFLCSTARQDRDSAGK